MLRAWRSAAAQKTGGHTELAAPHPYARIVVAADLEASIATVPVCVASASAPASPLPEQVMPLAVMAGPRTIIPAAADETCVQARNWTAATGLTWFNQLGGFKVTAGTSTVDIKNGNQVERKAAKVAVRSAASFVNVNAGTISGLSEKAVAVAVAHALGHYYRTHTTTAVDGKYDFWFDRAQHTAERPKPVTNPAEYTDQYNRLKLPRYLAPGQKFHPRITATLIAWLNEATLDAGHVCAGAQTAIKSTPGAIRDELVPLDPAVSEAALSAEALSFEARQALLALEPKIAACVDGVQLDDTPEPAEGALTFQASAMSRAWLANRIVAPMKTEVPAADIATAQTLRELVTVLETTGKKLDDAAPDFLKHLADNKIGRYSAEQEADELSMELATKLGLTPDEVIAGYIEMMYATEKQDPALFASRHGMSAKACEDLKNAGFKDGERQVYVALGSLDDPHHAFCYRLMNLQRERDAHAYPSAPPPINNDPTPWKDIQDAATELLHPGTLKPATTVPGTSTGPEESAVSVAGPGGGSPLAPPAADPISEEPNEESDPNVVKTKKSKAYAGGCSTTPGTSSSYSWLVGLAAALAFARRRLQKA